MVTETHDVEIIRLYKRRWLMLIIFIIYEAAGGFHWIQLVSISDVLVQFYGVSPTMVNWTSTVFMVDYLILFIPASYFLQKQGIRKTVVTGMFLTMVGSWIKLGSVDPDRFWVAFLGQCICGSASSLVFVVPARLAGVWFGASEVSTACGAAYMGSQIGPAVGMIMTPYIISIGEKQKMIYQFYVLHTISAVSCTIIFLITLVFFKEAPPLPPSYANAKQKTHRPENYISTLKNLFGDRSFILLFVSYGICNGIYNAIATLINPIILRFYAHAQHAVGSLGLILMVSGLAGSVVLGKVLDLYHKYKSTSVIVYAISVFTTLAFTTVIGKSLYIIYIVFLFMGFFMGGFGSIGIEFGAELIYPESEGICAALLTASMQIFGICYNIIYQRLFYCVNTAWANIFFCINMTVGMILLLFTESHFKRQAAENAAKKAVETAGKVSAEKAEKMAVENAEKLAAENEEKLKV